MLKFSIQKGRPLRFTERMSWSEELDEFKMIAQTAPLGDAEAYGHSLEEDQGDSDDLMDDLDDSEVLGEQLIIELEDNENGEEEEDEDDIYK